MIQYAVYFDDGEHSIHLDTFNTLEEANKLFFAEVEKFKQDPELYGGSTSDEWSDEFIPFFEVTTCDEANDLYFIDDVNSWMPGEGFAVEPK